MTAKRVVIVGAGIAGLVAALEAQAAGCAVTVLERGYPGGGNSGRNVGRIRRMLGEISGEGVGVLCVWGAVCVWRVMCVVCLCG